MRNLGRFMEVKKSSKKFFGIAFVLLDKKIKGGMITWLSRDIQRLANGHEAGEEPWKRIE
jgi:hypothetical protein